MGNKRNIRLIAGLSLLLALAAGCSKEDAPAPAAPAKPKKATPVAPPVPIQQQLSSAAGSGTGFDFSKKADPFKPYAPAVAAPDTGAAQPAARPAGDLLPIQSFEVSRFKVAGIIAGLHENRALLIDPNGKGYVVQKGMQIGNNNGRITKITASSVVVVERFKQSGSFKSRTIELTLTKKR